MKVKNNMGEVSRKNVPIMHCFIFLSFLLILFQHFFIFFSFFFFGGGGGGGGMSHLSNS